MNSQQVKVMARKVKYGLYAISGENGSGKTRLLKFINKATELSGRKTYFLNGDDKLDTSILKRLDKDYRNLTSGETFLLYMQHMVDRIQRNSLLLIDNIGMLDNKRRRALNELLTKAAKAKNLKIIVVHPQPNELNIQKEAVMELNSA